MVTLIITVSMGSRGTAPGCARRLGEDDAVVEEVDGVAVPHLRRLRLIFLKITILIIIKNNNFNFYERRGCPAPAPIIIDVN